MADSGTDYLYKSPDVDTSNYNSMLVEADNYNYQSGDQSWLDKTDEAITLGGRAAVTAAVNSFINTGVVIGNWFGGDFSPSDTYADLNESDPAVAEYYKQHTNTVELAGFLGGSILPGMAGVKAFQLAKAGIAGNRIARAAGLFSRPKDALVASTLEAIQNGAPSIDSAIKLNKYKALAYGFGDQALQAAAWETAVAATMGASPVLSNADWKDIGLNIAIGAGVGGVIGGLFDGFGIVGQFNRARMLTDLKFRASEALTNLGKGDYIAGDRVVALLQSMDELPTATEAAASTKVAQSRRNALLDSRKILNGISEDPELSNSFFDSVLALKDAGASNDEIYMYLAQTKRLERITPADQVQQTRFFVNPKPKNIQDTLINEAPDEKSIAFILRNEANPVQIATFGSKVESGQYPTARAAFDAGVDIWIDANNLSKINPKSANLAITTRVGFTNTSQTEGAPLILNLRNGRITDTALPQLGDLVESSKIYLKADKETLVYGDNNFTYSLAEGSDYFNDPNYLRANGRFIWASERGIRSGDVVSANDLPMLDAILQLASKTKPDDPQFKRLINSVELEYPESGQREKLFYALQNFPEILEDAKRNVALKLLNGNGETAENGFRAGMDAREIAARTNTDIRWLESGLPKTNTIVDFSPDPALVKTPSAVKIIYDVGDPVKDIDGMVARGMIGVQARIARAKDLANSTVANYLGPAIDQLPIIDPEFSQMQATSLGAGASAVGFANANYGSVGAMFESVGAFVHNYKTELINKVKDIITPSYLKLINDPAAAAELGILQNVMRGSAEKYVWAEDGKTLIIKGLKDQLDMGIGGGTQTFLKKEGKGLAPEDYLYKIGGQREGRDISEKGKFVAYEVSDKVAEWLKANQAANTTRLSGLNSWYAAQGVNRRLDSEVVYFPPVDTRKYNFVAFVREPAGNGASSSSVSALTASSESDLNALINQVRTKFPNYDVLTKGDIKRFHEARGDYDYNLHLVDNSVDDTLKREGILANYFPETRADKVLDDWVGWHEKQETRLLRNMIELNYAQQFAELRDLGKSYVDLATSRMQGAGQFFSRTAENPYDDYIKTALDISKKAEYRLWSDANEKVEAWFDTAFNTAKRTFSDATKGLTTYEQANALTQKFGLGSPFQTAGDYFQAQKLLPPAPYLRTFIAKANSILAATTLRLDFLQSVINTISTPILLGSEVSSIRRNLSDPTRVGKLNQLLTTELPGGSAGETILSTPKLIYNAVNNMFGEQGEKLANAYRKTGIDVSLLRQQQSMLGELSFTGTETESVLNRKFANAVAMGEKLTGNSFAEHFTRFVSADVMRQITEAAGISGPEQLAYIRTFVNRVQGNYIASQRPIAFQGVLGQAMGLFQTYQFNLMQQLFRHVENGDVKTVGTLLGLQSTLFGFQGLPLFSAVNTHIIGNAPGNPAHTDVYSAIPQLVGKSLGDLLLYGGASWASGTALYSRGDINPRTVTVLPIDPTQWPAVDGFIRFASNIYNMGSKLANGGAFVPTMLEGLEHNAISRPLAGLAQVWQGYTTTTPGDLISRTNEVNAVSNAARLAGAKPINEAIALDAAYRSKAYQAKDLARIQDLGSAIRTTIIGGGVPNEQQVADFATKYAAAGGRIENFNAFWVNQMKNVSESKLNQVFKHLNSPISRNMMEIMGGEKVPDFTNLSSKQ